MSATYFGAVPVARFASESAVVHVRFVGQRFDVPLSRLEVCAASEDYRIKRAVAGYLCLPQGAMESYAIDRHADGNLTIRPASA